MSRTMTPIPIDDEIARLYDEILAIKERIAGVNRLLHTGNIIGEAAIQAYEALMDTLWLLFEKRERLITMLLHRDFSSE
jgi:hypothetical protein